MKAPARLIQNPPQNLRERRRADGSVRIWWEPATSARALGFTSVELDERRLTWSTREAEKLNADLARAVKAGRRVPKPSGRSIEALVETYRKSLAWRQLAAKTQQSYNANFRLIIEKWGPHQVRDFTKPVMRTWYETLYDSRGAHQAMALTRAMSLLFSFAELVGWRAEGTNPCSRLKMTTPDPRKRSASWTEIDALIDAADRLGLSSMAAGILLSLLQGQRQTDVILARISDFRIQQHTPGDAPLIQWTFTRSKRGNASALWLHEEVAPRVRLMLCATPDADQRLLRDELTGRDFNVDLFSKRWRAIRDAAIAADKSGKMKALSGLQFRDLRRTFGVMSRAGGATKDDTADVLGNSAATNPRLAETYMPGQIDTASRAIRAIQRPSSGDRKKA